MQSEVYRALGAVLTIAFGAILLGMVINTWVRSAKPLLSRKIRDHGIKTVAEIVDFKQKPFHATKIAFMMNIAYDTPHGRVKRYYKKIITKDRVRLYQNRYGNFFYQGAKLPIAYLPENPDRFIVFHDVETEEKKRVNFLMIIGILIVIVFPLVMYLFRNVFNS